MREQLKTFAQHYISYSTLVVICFLHGVVRIALKHNIADMEVESEVGDFAVEPNKACYILTSNMHNTIKLYSFCPIVIPAEEMVPQCLYCKKRFDEKYIR